MSDLANDGFLDFSGLLHCAVYALVRRGEVVYVGQSKSLSERLITHIRNRVKGAVKRTGYFGSNQMKSGFSFDAIWVRPCMLAELSTIEIAMIKKYQPKYNIRHKEVESTPPELLELIKLITAPPPASPPVVFRRRV